MGWNRSAEREKIKSELLRASGKVCFTVLNFQKEIGRQREISRKEDYNFNLSGGKKNMLCYEIRKAAYLKESRN